MHVFVVSGVCLRGTAGCRRRSAAGYNSITNLMIIWDSPFPSQGPKLLLVCTVY